MYLVYYKRLKLTINYSTVQLTQFYYVQYHIFYKYNFSQMTHLSPQSESKGKNEYLFSTPSIL